MLNQPMSKDSGQSTVAAEIKRNRLVVKLRGAITKKNAERLYTDIRFCVADLQPGFAVITDLSEARIGHLSAIGTFQKITSFLVEKKVGPVIRVVGSAGVFFRQLSRVSGDVDYKPMYAQNMAEAEILLADLMEQKFAA
jgi:MFS superfamily sulfate permease-like transporter